MEKLLIKKLEVGETIERFSDVILFKKGEETIAYDLKNTNDVYVSDVLSKIFEDYPLANFTVTCNEDQNFLAGLTTISDFKIFGILADGDHFEILFNHYYLDAEELLEVKNENEYVGNPEYGDRTTEWTAESEVDQTSDLYKLLKKQAELCKMELSQFDYMLEEIARNCTGGDTEY